MRLRSLRSRLVLVVVAVGLAGLLVASVATYIALRSFLIDRVDGTLQTSSVAIERAFRRPGPARFGALDQAGQLAPGMYVEVRDATGAVLFGEVLVRPGDEGVRPEPIGEPPSVPTTRGGFRVLGSPLRGGATLIVAVPLHETDETLDQLVRIEAAVTAAVLAALLVAALGLIRVGLRPLDRIGTDAAAIGAGDLSRRVTDADSRTEVGRLGLALNGMLAQIEAAFEERRASEERLRRFVADASHELRTPVAAVRAYAELFDRGARDRPDDLARAMAGIGREATRIGTLVDDLLLLAQLDQGRPLADQTVDLAGIAGEAVEAARLIDPDRPLMFDTVGPRLVRGDPDRLRQVIDNLLANVRAHTPAGTPAAVRLDRDDGWVVLEVVDAGAGFSAGEAERVFERFYRIDEARSRTQGGAGLGLAIVASIAAAHGGSTTAETPAGGGARFRVRLPEQHG